MGRAGRLAQRRSDGQTKEDFWWVDRQLTRLKGGDNHDIQQGFFIHSEPYVSTDQLSLEHVLNRRDELTRKHVSGPTKGSYMATERRYVPAYEEMEYEGMFALEVRGLWKMENDFMGGPFYSLTLVDEARGRLLTLEGTPTRPTSTSALTSGKWKASFARR